MGVFVPKTIKVELDDDTIKMVYHVIDRIEILFRGSIFWRGK